MGIFSVASANRALDTKDRRGCEDTKALRRAGNNAIATKRKGLMNSLVLMGNQEGDSDREVK